MELHQVAACAALHPHQEESRAAADGEDSTEVRQRIGSEVAAQRDKAVVGQLRTNADPVEQQQSRDVIDNMGSESRHPRAQHAAPVASHAPDRNAVGELCSDIAEAVLVRDHAVLGYTVNPARPEQARLQQQHQQHTFSVD